VGVLQSFERRLGSLVEGVFARAFKSQVQPVEVAAALQRELDAKAAVVARDRTLVPNHFIVELGDHDHDRLAPYAEPLTCELAEMVREHAADQRYAFVGPVSVELAHVPVLDTGVFHIRSEVAPGQQPASAAAEPPATSPPPAPPPARPAGRIVVREGHHAAYEFELRQIVTVIGRGLGADVPLTDAGVSRRHAEIRLAGGGPMLNDLQSTNGTTVNGARVTTAALTDGDEIRLGETVLVYHGPTAAPGARTPASAS
jgi:predicted component of type VI protein secretion system